MIAFDAAHKAVHHPPDRRFRIWIRPSVLIGAASAILALVAAAWVEVAVIGKRCRARLRGTGWRFRHGHSLRPCDRTCFGL